MNDGDYNDDSHRFPGLAVVAQVIAAIEEEHEPLYSTSAETFLESVVVALTSGCVLAGYTRTRDLVVARAGSVFVNGQFVRMRMNMARGDAGRVDLGSDLRRERGRAWHPAVELPGTTWDAGYVYFAIRGWQSADFDAIRAQGCEHCRRGLVELDSGTAAGAITEPCACQGYGSWDDDVHVEAPTRTELEQAVEEPGAWYSGAALAG